MLPNTTSPPSRAKFYGLLALLLLAGVFFYFNLPTVPNAPSSAPDPFIRHQKPEFLTFEELKEFSKNPHPGALLEEKLQRFWHTPIINNQAYYDGEKPRQLKNAELGPYLSLASWNIEKSIHMREAITAFSSGDKFRSLIDTKKAPAGSDGYKKVVRQRHRLGKSDVIVLQEMDIGVKRSDYIDAAAELAKTLKMNFAYAAEQLEVDPVHLGLQKIYYREGAEDREQMVHYRVDPQKYQGGFGVAVLSRYPIKNAWAFQLKNQAYDWYGGERSKIGFIEQSRRVGAKVLFHSQLTREMKVGGRIFFRVDLAVPDLPEETLTIINVHLEIKCLPKRRETQLAEILSYIKEIKHPVILVGDFNSAPEDLSSTSAWRVAHRTAQNPETWFPIVTNFISPHALLINTSRVLGKFTKNFNQPLAQHVPIILPNPLRPLFLMIQDYRFEDGGAFDFRGDQKRSIGDKRKPLANSNQYGQKGFKTTWKVKRPISILGKYRLDWIFVKSYLKDPYDKTGSYRFAPHWGETLEEMNTSLKTSISDHHPNVVNIPFQEPRISS